MRRSYLLFAGLLLVCIAFLSLGIVQEGEGKTITVDDDGGADYEKIQWAIDNATEGDTIRVWEGSYLENVLVDKTVSLVGNGSETTTIDGGGSGNVVQITVDWVNMSGFSVTGSGSSGIPDYDSGIKVEANHSHIFSNYCSNNRNGIFFNSTSDSTIHNNTCENNICSNNDVFGIDMDDSSDSTISNNICENNSQGIGLGRPSNCTIKNNICKNSNSGIGLFVPQDCTIENNICSGNNHVGIGLTNPSNCAITNNMCENNYGDGISLQKAKNCLVESNICKINDNGIYISSFSDNCRIANNNCSESNRYGIYLHKSPNNIISNNTSLENDYAGFFFYESPGCKIENNEGKIVGTHGEESYNEGSDDEDPNDGALPGFGLLGLILVLAGTTKARRKKI